jgi:ComF family protein
MAALTSTLRLAANAALDFIYPPVCASCERPTAGPRALCAVCWSRIRFIEHPFCPVLGRPFAHDPGEGTICAEALADPPVFDRLRAAAFHDSTAKMLVHGLKYRDRTDLARMMAGWMLRAGDGTVQGCDAIIPVPLHYARRMVRTFNQAGELARCLSRLAQKPLLPDAIVRVKWTRQQVGLGEKAREDNLRGAFKMTQSGQESVFGKRLILVDDVYTTGATVNAAARALKKAGAADITVLTFAMALDAPIYA